MAPLDYSKWDKIGVEEEEQEEWALPESTGQADAQRRILAHITRLRPHTPAREAGVFSHFIVAQDKGANTDNCHVHVDIIRLTSEVPDLLAESTIEFLAGLAQEMADSGGCRDNEAGLSGGEEAQLKRDAKQVMGALNTAAACRQYGTVAFFSQVCTPSNELAYNLRSKYAREEFARRIMMRRVFGDRFDEFERDESKEKKVEPGICPDWCSVL